MHGAQAELGFSTDTSVSVGVARAMFSSLLRTGLPATELLRAAQLDPRWLEAGQGDVRRSELSRLCEAGLDVSGDDALALRWGASLHQQSLGVVSMLVKHAATLREAFEAFSRFSGLLADVAGTRLIEQGALITLLLIQPRHASLRLQRCLAELTLVGMYRLIRSYSPAGGIEHVSFAYPEPGYRSAYIPVFGSAARFDQPFTAIQFDRALMKVPSPYQDEDLHWAVRALAERRLMRAAGRTPYSVRVGEFLIRFQAPHRVSMHDVARHLDLSVRSLRRRITEEGKSFREIANEACQVVATRLIGDERQTIQETAFAMGFTDTTAFHRAFKRWTGATPTGFRVGSTQALRDQTRGEWPAQLQPQPPPPAPSAPTDPSR